MAYKDLILAAASNYTYDHVKYWINSIKRSGFEGDIGMVCTNMRVDEMSKIAEKGVNIMVYGKPDAANIGWWNDSKLAPHVERFFYLWNYLNNGEKYRYVVTTDVRDVVFQSNPIEFMEQELGTYGLIAAAEGLKYEDEPWGNGNLELAFGPFFHNKLKSKMIYNVGVIAGRHQDVEDMLLMIYQMSINRPYEVVDQAVYNFLLNVSTFGNRVSFQDNDSGWACNLGTTIPAIESGHGDIGRLSNKEYMDKYMKVYEGEQPNILGDIVCVDEDPYVIVHQYDRVKGLKEKIMEKFDD